MSRNTTFRSSTHEPFKAQRSLELQDDHTTGPVSFLNPTRALFKHTASINASMGRSNHDEEGPDVSPKPESLHDVPQNERHASNIEFKWRSRDNRKGRHTLIVDPSSDPSAKYLAPKDTSGPRAVLRGIKRMGTEFPYWDVSWLVAIIFTLGSAVWVINAFFSYLPLAQPGTFFHNEVLVGGGVSAFIGATIFEIGSVLLMIEVCDPRLEQPLPA